MQRDASIVVGVVDVDNDVVDVLKPVSNGALGMALPCRMMAGSAEAGDYR